MSGDAIEVEGVVLAEARGGLYRVEARIGETTREVLAKCSGRLITRHIRVVPGDVVTLELNPYDTTRGRIMFRGKRGADP